MFEGDLHLLPPKYGLKTQGQEIQLFELLRIMMLLFFYIVKPNK